MTKEEFLLEDLQQKFWVNFKQYAKDNYPKLGKGEAKSGNFYDIMCGGKYYLALTIASNGNKKLACEIYIKNSLVTYRQFLKNKEEISKLVSGLAWIEKAGSKLRKIRKNTEADITEEEKWGQYFEWLGFNALKLQEVGDKYYDPNNFVFDEEEFQEISQSATIKVLKKGKIRRKKKANSPASSVWSRDPNMAYTAISKAKFQCEYNPSHQTFISAVSSHQFVEAHHLIPMEFQDEFEVSIDVPENIISLCPNCHRAFHNSTEEIKLEYIKKFYNKRKESLLEREINIEESKLLEYYKIASRNV